MNDDDEVTRALIRARKRLTDPARWTTEAVARDPDGRPAFPRAPNAVAWCALGALEAETPPFRRGAPQWVYLHAMRRLYEAAGVDAEALNDERGHAAVLAMYDAAIRRK